MGSHHNEPGPSFNLMGSGFFANSAQGRLDAARRLAYREKNRIIQMMPVNTRLITTQVTIGK